MFSDTIPGRLPPLPRPAGADTSFSVIHWYALGSAVCCAALFLWWVLFQNTHRCQECGAAPVLCRCPATDH